MSCRTGPLYLRTKQIWIWFQIFQLGPISHHNTVFKSDTVQKYCICLGKGGLFGIASVKSLEDKTEQKNYASEAQLV